ncbi:hypothetical protein ACNPFI_20090 [Klebsiella pneumoniae]
MAGDKITLTKIKQANRMVIVFYYRPLLTIRASVILVRERMMNKSQQVQTISDNHPGRRPANGGGGGKKSR